MPLFETITLPDGILGIWELNESPEQLSPLFTPEELADPEFLKYTFGKRKAEWLCTRLLLKQLIGADFHITYSEYGKPILKHGLYKFIAISHSREFVAVLVHKYADVGIDIENITRNYAAIQKKYLSENELLQVNGDAKLQSLYWCAKEAIFKLVPEDGIEFREQIRIIEFDPEKTDQFQAQFVSGEKQLTYRLYFRIISNNCLVWVIGITEIGIQGPDQK